MSSFPRRFSCHQLIHRPPSRAAFEHIRVFAPSTTARRSVNLRLSARWTNRSATVCSQSSPSSAQLRFSPTKARQHSPSCWRKIEREPCGASGPHAAATNPIHLLQQLEKNIPCVRTEFTKIHQNLIRRILIEALIGFNRRSRSLILEVLRIFFCKGNRKH